MLPSRSLNLSDPAGQVVGVDVNAAILDTARRRAIDAGVRNVEFIAGDARGLAFADKFDAIVGRFVLMYMAYPREAFATLMTHLKPGGIAAFQEPEYTLYPAFLHPDTPLMNQLIRWILDVFEHSGAHLDMGLGLYRAFLDAGLPPPMMHLESPIGAAKTWAGYRYMATIFQSLLPLLKKIRTCDGGTGRCGYISHTAARRGACVEASIFLAVAHNCVCSTSSLNFPNFLMWRAADC